MWGGGGCCPGEALVCVVWPHAAPNFPALPQRLGIVYCFNRPCALYCVAAPYTSAAAAAAGGASDSAPEARALPSLKRRCVFASLTIYRLPFIDDLGPAEGQHLVAQPLHRSV